MNLNKILKKRANKKEIEIKGRIYNLLIFPELIDEDLNIFDGVIFTKINSKNRLNKIYNYKLPLSGYNPRLFVIKHEDNIIIIDKRKKRKKETTLKELKTLFNNKITEKSLKNFFED